MKCPICGLEIDNDMGYCYNCEEITCSIHDDDEILIGPYEPHEHPEDAVPVLVGIIEEE